MTVLPDSCVTTDVATERASLIDVSQDSFSGLKLSLVILNCQIFTVRNFNVSIELVYYKFKLCTIITLIVIFWIIRVYLLHYCMYMIN